MAEKGLKAQEFHLNLRAGDQQDPEYLRLNPKSYVPTLVNGEDVVTESNVICAYLDEVFPDPALMPADPMGRARVRYWMRQTDERIHTACVVLSNTIAFRHQWLSRPPEELAETIRKTPDFEIRERRRDIIENGANSFRFKAAVMAYRALTFGDAGGAGQDEVARRRVNSPSAISRSSPTSIALPNCNWRFFGKTCRTSHAGMPRCVTAPAFKVRCETMTSPPISS